MIHLSYNTTKVITFYLQPSISTPTYLFSLINYTTRKKKNFISSDLSGVSDLLQFSITEVGEGSENVLTGDISIKKFGRYTLQVYEQASTTNLDETLATFLGDDELITHKEPIYAAPPPRNPVVNGGEEVCTLTTTVSVTNETSFGANDGTATANDLGGQGTITYLWDDPLAQTTKVATSLAPNTYTVIVSDSIKVGCTDTDSGTVSSAAFSPSDVPGLKLWLDASDASSINLGSPSFNDPVSLWSDLSINGFDATQTTPSAQPLWKTTHVQADGNDWMTLGKVISKLPNRSVYCVYKADSLGDQFVFGDISLGASNITTSLRLRLSSATGKHESSFGDGALSQIVDGSSATTTDKTRYSERFSGGSLTRMKVNGIDETEVNGGGSGATSIAGAKENFSIFRIGDFASLNMSGAIFGLLVYDNDVSDENDVLINNYMATQH